MIEGEVPHQAMYWHTFCLEMASPESLGYRGHCWLAKSIEGRIVMKKSGFVLATVVLSALILAGCSNQPAATGEGDYTIKFGFSPWIGEVGPIMADAKKIFDAKGVKVEFVKIEGNTKDAFLADKLDVVIQSYDAVIQMKAKQEANDPIQIIAIMDGSKGADGIVGSKDVKTLADIKGKSVAVAVGSVAHFMLLKGLSTVGLTENDVKMVAMNNSLAGSSLIAGKVDAAVTWEPYLSKAKAAGGSILYSTADAPDLIVDAVVVKKHLIDQHPEAVRKMLAAFDEGLAEFGKSDDAKALVAKALDMTVEDINASIPTLALTTLADSKVLLVDQRAALEKTLAAYQQFFIDQKVMTAPIDLSDIINDTYLK